MQVLCPRSILLDEGAYLRLEFLLQPVEKDMLPKAALSPTEPLFFLTMGRAADNQTTDPGTLVWVLEAKGMNP